MFNGMNLKTTVLLLSLMSYAPSALSANKCEQIFNEVAAKEMAGAHINVLAKDPKVLWNQSIDALKSINSMVYGREQVIESLATAILAKEFVWINGEPGGAKTFLSRLMFQSVLNSIPESDKKIFVLQFHKLIAEGKISGFQKFSSMLKDGKYEIETESSLVGDKFLFLIADEAEKSNPAVLNALLSVLNERKAFLGAKVVDSILSSGVFTSNKTTGEFIQGFMNDRPSGEALLDRMAIKIHIPNQQLSHLESVKMYNMVKNPQKVKNTLPLLDLQALVAKVQIPDQMMADIVSIARDIDRYVTKKSDLSRQAVRYGEAESEYFPANQFSNRSVRRLVQVFKASLIAKQLSDQVPYENIRLTPLPSDMLLLARSALYSGPSGIHLKSFDLGEFPMALQLPRGNFVTFNFSYNPYEGTVLVKDKAGTTDYVLKKDAKGAWQVTFEHWRNTENQSPLFEGVKPTINPEIVAKLEEAIKKTIEENGIDPAKPQFEVDDNIDKLIARGTVKERTRNELMSIKKDLEQFSNTLAQHFDKDASSRAKVPSQNKLLAARTAKEKRDLRRQTLNAPADVRVSRYYDWMVYEVQALKQRFVELDHSIEAHLTGMLSENHLYVFGPPGGAKTALAEVILKGELKKLNADQVDSFTTKILTSKKVDQKFIRAVLENMRREKPKVFDRFLLQFHKLLPEGVLVGFPKIEKQLNEGKEEIEVSTSLASDKFVFAILDEVDKANPQTITALLSILNEREVFAGSQVIKAALRTAILTSNKMPSEFLDSYNEDRSTGEAIMDRAINKVYVSNKISSEEALTQFLINLEKGISPNWKGLLGVSELKPLLDKIEWENEAPYMHMLAELHQKFLALRVKKEEETQKATKMDPREFPDYYVSAAGSASDRTMIKLFDQFKARFIINQLMNGVAFKDLRLTIEMKDMALFFEGLGYWSPQKIETAYNKDGALEFRTNSQVLENLKNSGVADSRVKFQLEMMIEEAKDFTQVLNSSVTTFMTEYKAAILEHPDLYPSLFENPAARKKLGY